MYKLLKLMLKAAESIGVVERVNLDSNSYQGDYIEIHGVANDGGFFHLELKVNNNANS